MTVEFVGCSSVGKTTLHRAVYSNLSASKNRVFTPLELFIGKRLSGLIRSERVRNFLLDLLSLPWVLGSLWKHGNFLKFSWKSLREHVDFHWFRLLIFRSILRKVGLFVFLQREKFQDYIVLMDEGPVHVAHLIFNWHTKSGVRNDTDIVTSEEIAQFLELVPKPEMIVHVTAPLPVIIQRTLHRKDPPIRGGSEEVLKSYVTQAFNMFRVLCASTMFGDRLFEVEETRNFEAVVGEVVEHIFMKVDGKLPCCN